MSRPGDPGRRQLTATGAVEAVTVAAELVGTIPGARSFELRYDAVDRELAEDEEPRPDEAVRWEAVAVIARKYPGQRKPTEVTYVGSYVAEPGTDHGRAGAMAAVDLLEKLGANTVVIDLTEEASDG